MRTYQILGVYQTQIQPKLHNDQSKWEKSFIQGKESKEDTNLGRELSWEE